MTHKDASNPAIRNIAIIAHVDHGKTTLVDAMFRQIGVFREGQESPGAPHGQHGPGARARDHHRRQELLGASGRASRSTSWTPRATPISAARSSAPFRWWTAPSCWSTPPKAPCRRPASCSSKALAGAPVHHRRHQQDRPAGRPARRGAQPRSTTSSSTSGATEEQLEFPVLYAIGKRRASPRTALDGTSDRPAPAVRRRSSARSPRPAYDPAEPFQMLVSDLSYSDYFGRQAIGKVINGRAQLQGQPGLHRRGRRAASR
ncbi:MAG: GTP-binding protein [Desulfosudis oleivorans]|nr:GTP-binding protein [Desulfosudis oleivorans]